MKLGIKRLLVYATVGTLGLGTLTSCGPKKTEENTKVEEFDSVAKEELYEEVNKGDTKVFEPEKHKLFVRNFNLERITYAESITGGSLEEEPEGYEVLSITNYTISSGKTAGYDVWYQNTETVEVEAVYNESLEKYDYSHFGTVVETKENQAEESKQKTK